MKDIKRRFETYSFFDHTGIEMHLEKMAEKGWLIKKITNTGWIYRRIEPKKLLFTVTYYPKASAFDPEPTEEQKTFHEFCEHSGWILAATSAQMQIFYNEKENPIPIETDPVLELETIHNAAKKSFLPIYFVFLALAFLNGGLFISRLLGDPIGLLSSAANLLTGFSWTMLLLLCIVELGGYYLWRYKAKKAAERGEFLDTPNHSRLQRFILFVVVIGFACWVITSIMVGSHLQWFIGVLVILYMIVLIFLVNAIKQLLKRKKAPAGLNRTVTVVTSFVLAFAMMVTITFVTLKAVQSGAFEKDAEKYEYRGQTWILHQDELPLTVEDLLDVKFDGYIKEQRSNESLLLGQLVIHQHPRLDTENFKEIPDLEYTITVVKAPFLYNLCKDRLLREQDESSDERIPEGFKNVYEVKDATPWGAQEVYQLVSQDVGPMNWYLLCYKDRIIEIRFDWEPTSEQMSVVAEKLSDM